MKRWQGGPTRLSRSTRSMLALAALGLVMVFGIARVLEPDPRGFGTHTQLGLSPCAFALVTGQQCPTCGMTTSFAWFARGRFDRSWAVNPAGSVLAPTCLVLIPWLLASSASGRPVGFRSLERPLISLVTAAVVVSLLSWTIRLILGRVL